MRLRPARRLDPQQAARENRMMEIDKLAAEAFRVFHAMDLTCSEADKATNRYVTLVSIIERVGKLCEHDAVGLLLLMERLIEMQEARHRSN
jgi:hypothetical protein